MDTCLFIYGFSINRWTLYNLIHYFENMIRNINYKGHVSHDDLVKFSFTKDKPPYQIVLSIDNVGKLLLFPSGKCRLMGLKRPFSVNMRLPLRIHDIEIQSITLTYNFGSRINLLKVSQIMPCTDHMYEPELFPALRLTKYNPICVNVFATGKVVILGVKSLAYQSLLNSIARDLWVYKAE